MLNRGELQRLEEEANLIVNRTKDLIDDLAEKTQMATEIFMHHLFNPEKQLSLESHPENENDEPEGTESSSSLTGFVEVENLAMKTDSE